MFASGLSGKLLFWQIGEKWETMKSGMGALRYHNNLRVILVTMIVSTVGSTSVDGGSSLTIVPDMTVTGGRVLTQLSPQLHTIDGVHFMQGPQLLCR